MTSSTNVSDYPNLKEIQTSADFRTYIDTAITH